MIDYGGVSLQVGVLNNLQNGTIGDFGMLVAEMLIPSMICLPLLF
ncbi:hypothetical protein ABFY57_00385 [Paenibacillus polymyxa]